MLIRHARSKSSGDTSSIEPQTPEPALKTRTSTSPSSASVRSNALATDAASADVAGIGFRARQLARKPCGEVGSPRHQRDGVAVGGKAPGEGFAVARADPDDGADGNLVVRHGSILHESGLPAGDDPATRAERAQSRPAARRQRRLTARRVPRQLRPLRPRESRRGAKHSRGRKAKEPMKNAQPWLKSYPAGMRWDAPIDIASVQSVLDESARRFGPLPALQFMDKRITYAELEALAESRRGRLPEARRRAWRPRRPLSAQHSPLRDRLLRRA